MKTAVPHFMHIGDNGRELYVDMYIEKFGTGELPRKYEKALVRHFRTKDKKEMLRRALHSDTVVIMCPESKKIEIVDATSGELVKRLGRVAGMKFDRDDDGYAEVSCRVYGDGLHSILKILRHCQYHGQIGHSFSIVSDPDNSEYKMTTGWDGDGSDSIEDIKVNGKKLNQKQFDKEEMKISSVADRLTESMFAEGQKKHPKITGVAPSSREASISKRLSREEKIAISVARSLVLKKS